MTITDDFKHIKTFAFLLCVAPFVLNDFAFIALNGTYGIYIVDYITRGSVLLLCLIWPLGRSIAQKSSRSKPSLIFMILAIVILPILGRLLNTFIEVPIVNFTGWTGLFQFQHIKNPNLYWLDLSLGLFAVALSEELIFRKFALNWLLGLNKSNWQIILISACFFSLIHWGNGIGRLAYTFGFGLMYMALYLKLKRLWPLVVAHWIDDVIAFSSW